MNLDDEFPGARGYLDTATLGLPCRATVEGLQTTIADWQAGQADPFVYDDHVRRSREAFARIAGVPATCVATAGQVSSLVALVAGGLPAGAQVLAPEGEFTSVIFPFMARADLSVRFAPLAGLADAVTADTALVALSAVQSADGALADRTAIREAATAVGARLLVDVTQAASWQPVAAAEADYVVCGTYKWLLSPRGTAFLAGSPERLAELPALHAGWYAGEHPWTSIYGAPLRLASDARRLDLSPAWLCWAGRRRRSSSSSRRASTRSGSTTSRSPRACEPRPACPRTAPRSSRCPLDDAACARLRAAGARFSLRDGRARLSFHFYNDDSDVDLVLDALGLG